MSMTFGFNRLAPVVFPKLNCTVVLGEDHDCGHPMYDLNDVKYQETCENILPFLAEAAKNPNYKYYNRTFKVRAFKICDSNETLCLARSDREKEMKPEELIEIINKVQRGYLPLQPCTKCIMPETRFPQTVMEAKRLSLDNFM